MILCTNYGLLVYDFIIEPEKKEESKDAKAEKQLDLTIKYKISVLPTEQVVDIVILDPKRPRESQLLVCCNSGAYVILRRNNLNSFTEAWKFKGFSLPPKGFIACDDNRVLVIEARSLALIDVRKKEIAQFITKIPANPPLTKPGSILQTQELLPSLLERVTGPRCVTLLNQPGPTSVKHEVVKSQTPSKQPGAKSKTNIVTITNFPAAMGNARELVIL